MHWHCRHYAYARLGFWCKLSFSSVNHWNAYTSLIKVFTDILIFFKGIRYNYRSHYFGALIKKIYLTLNCKIMVIFQKCVKEYVNYFFIQYCIFDTYVENYLTIHYDFFYSCTFKIILEHAL